MQSSSNTGEAKRLLSALVRAAVSKKPLAQLQAHKNAYRLGAVAIPAISEMLMNEDWTSLRYPEKMAYFTCLTVLLHDIDENESRRLAGALLRRSPPPHSVYVQRLETVTRFTVDDYHDIDHCEIRVFVHKCLSNAHQVSGHIERWLRNVPPEDLKGISRLYVINMDQDQFWASYLRILASIVLIWRPQLGGIIPIRLLRTEGSLYHEIGHHAAWVDDDLPAEAELRADAYSCSLIRIAHPFLAGGLLSRITMPLIYRQRWRAARRWRELQSD